MPTLGVGGYCIWGESVGGGRVCQGTMTSSKTVAANKEKEVSDSVRMILSA